MISASVVVGFVTSDAMGNCRCYLYAVIFICFHLICASILKPRDSHHPADYEQPPDAHAVLRLNGRGGAHYARSMESDQATELRYAVARRDPLQPRDARKLCSAHGGLESAPAAGGLPRRHS
jgi:hypothetical protein